MKNLIRFSVVALSLLMVLPANAAQFEKNLAFGSRTPDVSKLQEFLTDQGIYSGPITGNFFSLTLKAVKAFQVKVQVPSTGFFGSLSRGKANEILDAELADSENDPEALGTTVETPSTTADVVSKLGEQTKVLQDQLAAQQAQNALLQKQIDATQAAQQQMQSTLNTVASNTTPVVPSQTISAPVQIVTPSLEPAYELWQLPDRVGVNYLGSSTIQFVINKPITVQYNYQPLNASVSTFEGCPIQWGENKGNLVGTIFTCLPVGNTYNYTWTYHESGRQDSGPFNGSFTVK